MYSFTNIVLQGAESRQGTQRAEIFDVLREPSCHLGDSEIRPASSVQFTRIAQYLVKPGFWIRQILASSQGRQVQRNSAGGITGSEPDGGFIEKEPRLLHPDRNHSDPDGHWEYRRCLDRRLYLT